MRIVRVERKRISTEPARAPIWLVGITDLVTLLLAFFILLFATSVPKTEPWNAASQSVRSSFGGKENITEMQGEAGHQEADKTWISEDSDPGLNLDYLYSVVKKYVASDPSLTGVTVWKDNDVVVASFGSEISFAPGRTELSASGMRLLLALTPFFSKLPNTLEVVGYADSTPIQSSDRFESNWHLSLSRAESVADFLRDSGYDAEIVVRGRGTSDNDRLPADLPEDKRNELARRVDLRLHLLQP